MAKLTMVLTVYFNNSSSKEYIQNDIEQTNHVTERWKDR